MQDDRRIPHHSENYTCDGENVAAETVDRIEGAQASAPLQIKPLLTGDNMFLMEIRRSKGLVDATHAHADHESMCYLVSGRMRVIIDGNEFVAKAGDSWIHPPGVAHYSETLEDSVQVEVKSPPRRTW